MEWDYHSKPARWVLVVDTWRDGGTPGGATVRWTPRVEQVGESSERYEGPTVDDPMQGRTWCLTKIAELRG